MGAKDVSGGWAGKRLETSMLLAQFLKGPFYLTSNSLEIFKSSSFVCLV